MCALSGRTPVVLCPCRDSIKNDSSQDLECLFVGDAYVCGLMDGEALDMVKNGVLEMQTLIPETVLITTPTRAFLVLQIWVPAHSSRQ